MLYYHLSNAVNFNEYIYDDFKKHEVTRFSPGTSKEKIFYRNVRFDLLIIIIEVLMTFYKKKRDILWK